MSVRAAAVPVVRAVRVPSATVRGRSAAVMAIVRTARTVIVLRVIVLRVIALKAIVLRVTAPMPIVRVRKASGSGRGVISATVRSSRVIARMVIARVPSVTVLMAIAPRATVRARSAIVRMARRGATAHMGIVPTVTARRAIVRAPTAALAASVVAAVVVAAVAALPRGA